MVYLSGQAERKGKVFEAEPQTDQTEMAYMAPRSVHFIILWNTFASICAENRVKALKVSFYRFFKWNVEKQIESIENFYAMTEIETLNIIAAVAYF